MKLNNNKNIILCAKALYAEQLKCYASLCECYKELADKLGRNATAEDVQKKYAPYLSLASKGDLSFLEKENNYIYSEAYQGARFQNMELRIFEKYAEQSKKLFQFKDAATIISQSLIKDDITHNEYIQLYREYMKKTSPSTRNFDREIDEHSPTYIGYSYYTSTCKSISDIRNIDPSHLSGIPVSIKLTPDQFGAIISGFTTMDKLLETATQKSYFIDFKEEQEQYPKIVNSNKDGYVFWAKNQNGINLSLSSIKALGLTNNIINKVNNNHDHNNMQIETSYDKKYKKDLSADNVR